MENKTVVELRELLRKKGKKVSGTKMELIERLQQNSPYSHQKSRRRSISQIPGNVLNKKLYRDVKERVKKQVKTWPSAYASSLLVQEYKKAGGKYSGQRNSSPLRRWHEEKWVDVSRPRKSGGYESCGRASSSRHKKYPYCRPSKKISNATPMTVGELKSKYGNKKIRQLIREKRQTALPEKGRSKRISSSLKIKRIKD